MTTHHRVQNDGVARNPKSRKNIISTAIEVSKLEECLNVEYIDYEYIHSD